MKLNIIVRLMLFACLMYGVVACQNDILDEQEQEEGGQSLHPVRLSFDFSKAPVAWESRAGNAADDLLHEEGEVKSLLYAVFKGNQRMHCNYIVFDKAMHTGDSYSVLNLKSEWFDQTTEVFALANMEANDTLKTKLELETRIEAWKNSIYTVDLNDEVSKNDSRLVNKAIMAGYLNLKDGVTDKISVKLERIYCRIWFSFLWQNHPIAKQVTIQEVKVSGLHQRSKLFNYHQYIWEDTISAKQEIKVPYVIRNGDEGQLPFMGRLTQAPYFEGTKPGMDFIENLNQKYNILCRFPGQNGTIDQSRPPVRYYVYSLQRGGTGVAQDPLIEVKYKFEYPGFGTLYRKASAYLYDKMSNEGKKHHGLLRNYTYQLNCVVNTITNSMDLQVVSVPWYETTIDDIPSFE